MEPRVNCIINHQVNLLQIFRWRQLLERKTGIGREFETELGLVEAKAQQDIHIDAKCELLLRPAHQISATEQSSVMALSNNLWEIITAMLLMPTVADY